MTLDEETTARIEQVVRENDDLRAIVKAYMKAYPAFHDGIWSESSMGIEFRARKLLEGK
jgi:hypothetical protein